MDIGPTWLVSAFTHRGLVRRKNEDAIAVDDQVITGDMPAPLTFYLDDDGCVLMVADGIGGHNAGAIASRLVIAQLVRRIKASATIYDCARAIAEANQNLHDATHQQPDLAGMGSTLVGVVLRQTEMVSFNVGDSRLYLQTSHHLIQISRDDVPEGNIDHRGWRTTQGITQAIGGSRHFLVVAPHVAMDPSPTLGETLLLCSDGLTDLVSDDAISRILTDTADLNLATRHLAALALRRGGYDNVSIVVARRAQS